MRRLRPTNSPFDDEQRRIIVTARARLDWIDSLPEPERTLASCGTPQEDWPRSKQFILDTLDVIAGRTERVWHPEGRYWTTERKP